MNDLFSMINIFRTIGCIGDSLSSGEFEYDVNGEVGFWDYYEYSWGKIIERQTGVNMTNFSRGGLTAYQVYNEADTQTSPTHNINLLFDEENIKQAYIIALGVNDIKGKDVLKTFYGGEVGNAASDINKDDYNMNADSFVGWYARIIQRLQSIQPDTKFFLITMPNDQGTEEYFSEVIQGIASKLDNCYVIDMFHDYPAYDKAFHEKYFSGSHMNAMGYVISAQYIMDGIDRIIQNNPKEFKNVQFIGSKYKPR